MMTPTLLSAMPARGNPRKFGIYYGSRFDPELSTFDVLVLDADGGLDLVEVRRRAKAPQTILGYVALCELGPGRSYAPKIRQAGLLLHESPYWRGSFYVDIRRTEWQQMLIRVVLPSILMGGFDGLFLDTIDDAPWLEASSNRSLPGFSAAAVALVHEIRRLFPNCALMLNRGFDLLPKLECDLDMILAESILITGVGGEQKPIQVTQSYTARVKELRALLSRQPQLTVYSLDYWDPADKVGIREIYRIQRAHGFVPYVGTLSLTKIIPEPV